MSQKTTGVLLLPMAMSRQMAVNRAWSTVGVWSCVSLSYLDGYGGDGDDGDAELCCDRRVEIGSLGGSAQ